MTREIGLRNILSQISGFELFLSSFALIALLLFLDAHTRARADANTQWLLQRSQPERSSPDVISTLQGKETDIEKSRRESGGTDVLLPTYSVTGRNYKVSREEP